MLSVVRPSVFRPVEVPHAVRALLGLTPTGLTCVVWNKSLQVSAFCPAATSTNVEFSFVPLLHGSSSYAAHEGMFLNGFTVPPQSDGVFATPSLSCAAMYSLASSESPDACDELFVSVLDCSLSPLYNRALENDSAVERDIERDGWLSTARKRGFHSYVDVVDDTTIYAILPEHATPRLLLAFRPANSSSGH